MLKHMAAPTTEADPGEGYAKFEMTEEGLASSKESSTLDKTLGYINAEI